MIERITDKVFRVRKSDIRNNITDVFEEIAQFHRCDFTYLLCERKEDSKVNGNWDTIKDIENDYRTFALVIIKRTASMTAL